MRIVLKDLNSFKTLLARKGYSKRGLGRAVGITGPYAIQLANGVRNPSPSVAKKISDVLEVSFDDIFYVDLDHKSNQDNQVAENHANTGI